eukprot:CAMPEP_0181180936 /NCGR_PEP_ID=MMETSP1096-20121128/7072_1 /TAXON_ID=156174 ORGANISM="Chrysochromulina ericina, Strain CCMP281" /NCGR_SAMPLE_ID=MMETSP1096 /ASSEMBLY_ACC=CAM_ASM_000453 /LENGTH=127 /DNA_ID=CAMNT_0023269411 /DNA_START=45 /DNA_END=428 /DNA_ORIENTATION=-
MDAWTDGGHILGGPNRGADTCTLRGCACRPQRGGQQAAHSVQRIYIHPTQAIPVSALCPPLAFNVDEGHLTIAALKHGVSEEEGRPCQLVALYSLHTRGDCAQLGDEVYPLLLVLLQVGNVHHQLIL